jgi:type VI protein secretion system component Hcp
MLQFTRRAFPIASALLIAGCSMNSAPTPFAASPAAAPANAVSSARAAARMNRTNVIYSSRVTFAGPDGRRYSGDAVVFPKDLFPGLRLPALAHGSSVVTPAAGALSYYLEVAGVKGGVTADSYRNWIATDTFSIGYGPTSDGKHPVTDLSITKPSDVASPALFGGLFSAPFTGPEPGGGSNGAELDVVQSDQGRLRKSMYFTFTKPVATSFTTDYASGDELPTETVTIAYQEAKFCVVPVTAGGGPGTPVCNTWTPQVEAK